MTDFYLPLLRVTLSWSGFLRPQGTRSLWQAAVYLTAAQVMAVFFVVVTIPGEFLDAGVARYVPPAAGLVLLYFNHYLSQRRRVDIVRRGDPAVFVAAYVVVLLMISLGVAAMLGFPAP